MTFTTKSVSSPRVYSPLPSLSNSTKVVSELLASSVTVSPTFTSLGLAAQRTNSAESVVVSALVVSAVTTVAPAAVLPATIASKTIAGISQVTGRNRPILGTPYQIL